MIPPPFCRRHFDLFFFTNCVKTKKKMQQNVPYWVNSLPPPSHFQQQPPPGTSPYPHSLTHQPPFWTPPTSHQPPPTPQVQAPLTEPHTHRRNPETGRFIRIGGRTDTILKRKELGKFRVKKKPENEEEKKKHTIISAEEKNQPPPSEEAQPEPRPSLKRKAPSVWDNFPKY